MSASARAAMFVYAIPRGVLQLLAMIFPRVTIARPRFTCAKEEHLPCSLLFAAFNVFRTCVPDYEPAKDTNKRYRTHTVASRRAAPSVD